MPAVYHACPAARSNFAHGGAYATIDDALQHARNASDAFSIGYAVFECLNGRPRRLATFQPTERAVVHPNPEARTP